MWEGLITNIFILSPCKRTQHCWPTTPNIVECYMLRPFAHPVSQSLKPVKILATCKRTQQLPTLFGQQCCELLRPFAHYCQHGRNNSQHCWANNVGSCCVRLHVALALEVPRVSSINVLPTTQKMV